MCVPIVRKPLLEMVLYYVTKEMYMNGFEIECKNVTKNLTLYILGYFYTVFVVGGGGKFAPLSKNRLVSDRSKIFCMLKLLFVKFLKIKILRF